MRRRLVLALAVCLAVAAAAATALAISFTDVQANNPQIAGDPTSNTTARFPTNKQNEPTIAVNPVDSSFPLAAAIPHLHFESLSLSLKSGLMAPVRPAKP